MPNVERLQGERQEPEYIVFLYRIPIPVPRITDTVLIIAGV